MEFALKTKIDELLKNLEKDKQLELSLKNQTIDNIERFKAEDAICDQLEKKLLELEDVLRKSEKENDTLKTKLIDTEAKFEQEEEFAENEQEYLDQLDAYRAKLTAQLEEVKSEDVHLSRAADELSTKIIPSRTASKAEDVKCERETERVEHLEKELQEVNERLVKAEERHEVIKTTNSDGARRLAEAEEKRSESEEKANKVDVEVSRLEKLLDTLSRTLEDLKVNQVKMEQEVEERRRLMKDEIEKAEGQLKKSTIHQAQSVSRKKK